MYRLFITGDLGFEFWMDIPGYEGLYQASTYGRIRSHKRRRTKGGILKQNRNHDYPTVGLGGVKTVFVHVLVAKTFLPNPENKPCVEHKDTVRTNNRVENLRYVTYFENNHNEITVEKLKRYHKRISKPVCAYDSNGTLIGTFKSIKEASRTFNASSTRISRCAHGKCKKVHGISFRFETTHSA